MTVPLKKTAVSLLSTVLISCATPTDHTVIHDSEPGNIPTDIASIPDAVPKYEPRTSAGNPVSYEVFGKLYHVLPDSKNYKERGIASWYGTKFHGRKTSNGESYDMFAMTAAHKTLPIPAYVKVTNLQNKRSIIVRVNDRGPFHEDRIIDLSYTAAVKLGIQKNGTGLVEVQAVEPGQNLMAEEESARPVNPVYLQIGAFSNLENAQTLQNKIATKQLPSTRILPDSHQGKPIFKVQLGPISSAGEIDRIKETLAKIGITKTRFAIDNNQDKDSMIQ